MSVVLREYKTNKEPIRKIDARATYLKITYIFDIAPKQFLTIYPKFPKAQVARSAFCILSELQRIVNINRIPNIFVFENLTNTE